MNTQLKNRYASAVLLLCGVLSVTAAELRLPTLFSDHMVLQRNQPVPVWGWAEPGAEVEVGFKGRNYAARADAEGRWEVRMGPFEADSTPQVLVVRLRDGSAAHSISNVLVGEVWLCSGQSNMAWPLRGTDNGRAVSALADHPEIRLFEVAFRSSPVPDEDVPGQWTPCTPESAATFPATAFYFARQLREQLGVPIGLLGSYKGGSPAMPWAPLETLRGHPEFERPVRRVESTTVEELEAAYTAAHARWAQRREEQPDEDPPLREPVHWSRNDRFPTGLYNAMIAPLVPYAIAGVIWYQGETDTNHGSDVYRTLFDALIRGWRKAWGREDLPFLYVQLANYRKRSAEPEFTTWDILREAQRNTLELPHTAMAVAIDIGSEGIHPGNKKDVGERLALAARHVVYGHDIVHSGPQFREMKVERNRVYLDFDHVGSGLVLMPPPTERDGSTPERALGFAVAGDDQVFHWAEAMVEQDRVAVWSDAVKRPIAVRYGWGINPAVNLYNREGLPAIPFRTDTWPMK